MKGPRRAELDSYLDELGTTPQGQIILVNMWDSVREKLVSKDFMARFLFDCVLLKERDPKPALDIFKKVCMELASSGSSNYLRAAKKKASSMEGNDWTTVTDWITWWRHHVDRVRVQTDLGEAIPALPCRSSTLVDVRELVKRLCKLPKWWKEARPEDGGWLGLPANFPSNCWVSCDAFPDDAKAPRYAADDVATSARDALGLINRQQNDLLVRYRFDAGSVRMLAGDEVARPTFADLGNERFRVRHNSKRGREFASQGWGATVHLGKLAQRPRAPVTGLPERVTCALPIGELKGLGLEVLGFVSNKLATSRDEEFLWNLLLCDKTDLIKEKMDRIKANLVRACY